MPPDETPHRRLRGRYLLSNWLWLVIVLLLIAIVVWGWAFDYGH